MKRIVPSLLLTTLVSSSAVALAEDSPHSFSGNVSLTSNYVFRGISQTGGDAAIQGGLDYSHSSGFYLGTWASNVGWIEDFQRYGSGSMEIDLYGGFRGDVGSTGLTFDVGAIRYMYPGKRYSTITTATAVDADTSEIYGALGWKWFTVKYSYYLSDGVFGFGGSGTPKADGSDYWDISASFPVGETGLTLGAHWGTFNFDKYPLQDYDDWKLSASYDLGKLSSVTSGVTVGLAYTDTNAKRTSWTDINNEFLGKDTWTFYISKSL